MQSRLEDRVEIVGYNIFDYPKLKKKFDANGEEHPMFTEYNVRAKKKKETNPEIEDESDTIQLFSGNQEMDKI